MQFLAERSAFIDELHREPTPFTWNRLDEQARQDRYAFFMREMWLSTLRGNASDSEKASEWWDERSFAWAQLAWNEGTPEQRDALDNFAECYAERIRLMDDGEMDHVNLPTTPLWLMANVYRWIHHMADPNAIAHETFAEQMSWALGTDRNTVEGMALS